MIEDHNFYFVEYMKQRLILMSIAMNEFLNRMGSCINII